MMDLICGTQGKQTEFWWRNLLGNVHLEDETVMGGQY
jgi:hypothetical protein